ncbi:MAG: hypothetical protein HPY85_02435 [Anaerolineae bacterium]|nr:hypothetical protein [Anaerolineae bacterium]
MGLNFFKLLSMVLALSAFIKVFFGVFFHEQFYKWARRQYAQKKRTTAVNFLLIYALALLILVWIGTLISHITNGWILTAFITIASLKSINMLFSWQKTAAKFVSFIDNAGKKLWFVDLTVGILGIFFLYLGLWVY